MSVFWLAMFGSFIHRRRKLVACLEYWEDSESETYAFHAKYRFDIGHFLTWPWHAVRQKIKFDDVIWLNYHHHRYLRVKWPRKHVLPGMFMAYFLVTWPWRWPFHVWPLYSGCNLLRHLPALCVSLSSLLPVYLPYNPNCKNSVFFTFDLTRELYLKRSNMH